MSEDIDVNKIRNQDTHPFYNQEPGEVIVPGSPMARERAKFEQFPTAYSQQPGRPYTYRPFPKMLYKAERRGGQLVCMEPAPQRAEFRDDKSYQMAEEDSRRFTEKCQRVVSEEEYSRAMEEGWRESPGEAVKEASRREDRFGLDVAHGNFDDRNLSERAKAEKSAAEAEAGEPLAEKPRSGVRKSKRVA